MRTEIAHISLRIALDGSVNLVYRSTMYPCSIVNVRSRAITKAECDIEYLCKGSRTSQLAFVSLGFISDVNSPSVKAEDL